MARTVKLEIRLFAFVTNEDGTHSICDIVETSYHHAYGFVRRWLRDPKVVAIGAQTPRNRVSSCLPRLVAPRN